ncbi:MAG: sigma-70 family RNA polymerase sigma factor [Pseudomonadales bacterium]|nr:sigma-70 family RNA polymerase sigma factor [Pseudomonadales bacterium]
MLATTKQQQIHERIQAHHSAVQAVLVRNIRHVHHAEDAMQEAIVKALQHWPVKGIPDNPRAWLTTVGMNSFRDRFRKESRLDPLTENSEKEEPHSAIDHTELEDDVLKLIFMSCHPAIATENQLALTLRMVMGFSMSEIASALLVPVKTLEKRISRTKRKISASGIDFALPAQSRLASRLDPVQLVLYLIFNEGYYGSSGQLVNRELCRQAIILTRSLCRVYPQPENFGLLALMLFNDSRSLARLNDKHELVTLDKQDRSLWKQSQIQEADVLLQKALRKKSVGVYQLQGAIAGIHSIAKEAEETDWQEIVLLYRELLKLKTTPVIQLSYAVALLFAGLNEEAEKLIQQLEPKLSAYSPFYAAQAKLFELKNNKPAMQAALEKATTLSGSTEAAQHYRTQL